MIAVDEKRLEELANSIADAARNGKMPISKLEALAHRLSHIGDAFKRLGEYEFEIPAGFNQDPWLDKFAIENKGKGFRIENCCKTLCNFPEKVVKETAGWKLRAGQRIRVTVFQITEIVTYEDCVEFLDAMGKMRLGFLGIALLKDSLPQDRICLSLSDYPVLCSSTPHGFCYGIPAVTLRNDGSMELDMNCCADKFGKGCCLLLFDVG